MTEKEYLKRDKYLLRKYGIGAADYQRMFEEQGGCCGICRRPQELFTKRFAVDHDHGWKRVKIDSGKNLSASENDHGWFARAFYLGAFIRTDRMKKNDAVRAMKARLKTKSVRGLLCPFCNRGLRYYADDPNRLANAAEYLKRHQNDTK
jgi:hypothetical protein